MFGCVFLILCFCRDVICAKLATNRLKTLCKPTNDLSFVIPFQNLSCFMVSVVYDKSFQSSRTNKVALVIECIGEKVALCVHECAFGIVEERKEFSNVVGLFFECLAKCFDVVQTNQNLLPFYASWITTIVRWNVRGAIHKPNFMRIKRIKSLCDVEVELFFTAFSILICQ